MYFPLRLLEMTSENLTEIFKKSDQEFLTDNYNLPLVNATTLL